MGLLCSRLRCPPSSSRDRGVNVVGAECRDRGRSWGTVQALLREPTVPQFYRPRPPPRCVPAPGDEAHAGEHLCRGVRPSAGAGASLCSALSGWGQGTPLSRREPSPTTAPRFAHRARAGAARGWPHSPHVSVLDGPVVGGPGVSVVQHRRVLTTAERKGRSAAHLHPQAPGAGAPSPAP